jgi:hypothetical protein
MRPSPRRVALLVDHGGLQTLLESSGRVRGTGELADRLRTLASSLGRVVSSTAYADWTSLGEDARAFRRRGIEPRLVLPLDSGDDRADVVLALDALELALSPAAPGIFVLAAGDGSLHDLVLRLRRAGSRVVVCGPRDATAPELARGADRFTPLEGLLEGSAAGVEAAPADGGHVDFDRYDWGPFLRLVDGLEHRLSFVGLKYLNHKVLNRENCGFDDRARRQTLINHVIDEGILEIYQIDNIDAGGDPVTACRLNRGHTRVKDVLGEPDGPATGPDTSSTGSDEPRSA